MLTGIDAHFREQTTSLRTAKGGHVPISQLPPRQLGVTMKEHAESTWMAWRPCCTYTVVQVDSSGSPTVIRRRYKTL
jgi:hypothetical protein